VDSRCDPVAKISLPALSCAHAGLQTLLAAPVTPAQTPAAHCVPACYDSHNPPESVFMSVATAASQTATPTAAETDPETLGWMQGFPAAAGQNHHLP
jgi:hypothetical protein